MTPEPNDQIVDPPVSSDDMDAFIKQLEDGYGDNINLSTLLPQGNADEPYDDEQEEEEQEDEETPPADSFTINGNAVSRADIERLYEFDQWMRSNPDGAQRVAQAIAGSGTPTGIPPVSQTPAPTDTPPAPTAPPEFQPPQPPEGFDLDDPQIKFLWDQQVEARRAQWEQGNKINEALTTISQQQQSQVQRQAAEDMDAALNQFRTQFSTLNDDDISLIRKEAAPLLPGMMQNLSGAAALFRSMEVAAWANGDIRKKLSEEPGTPNPTNQQRSHTRKRKLGAISGTPASAPKVDSRPQYRTDRDMVNEFAQALANEGLGR